jgi:hypothetical protein
VEAGHQVIDFGPRPVVRHLPPPWETHRHWEIRSESCQSKSQMAIRKDGDWPCHASDEIRVMKRMHTLTKALMLTRRAGA